MACPNCNRTMQGLVNEKPGARKFWCHFCGTLKLESGDVETVDVPTVMRHPAEIPMVAHLLNVATQALAFAKMASAFAPDAAVRLNSLHLFLGESSLEQQLELAIFKVKRGVA